MNTEKRSDAGAPSNWPPLSSANAAGSASRGPTSAGTNDLEVDPPVMPEFPVSVQFFEQACKDIGVVKLNIKELAALATVGDAARKFGPIKIGRGKLLVHDDKLGALIENCTQVIATAEKPELKVAAMSIMQKLLAGLANSARDMMKSAEIDLADQAAKPMQMPSFLPFRPVVPVQVNIDTGTKSVETRLNDQVGNERASTGSERKVPDPDGGRPSKH